LCGRFFQHSSRQQRRFWPKWYRWHRLQPGHCHPHYSGAGLYLAIAIALGKHNAIAAIVSRSWLFLVLSGIATGLSWLCYFRALQLGPASAVAPIDKLSVVLVILFAWIFLGEGLTMHKLVGGLVITGGAATLVFG
jgi:uncharacterized membrane protein